MTKSLLTTESQTAIRKFQQTLVRWFRKSGRDLPWRRTCDPYAVLVSEIMLQQTQVATVLPYYERWMQRFPNIEVLANGEEHEVLQLWQGLGYYSRARNLHRAAQSIMREHDGVFPRDIAKIRALPGVGRYTAGAIATFAFNQSVAIVDANIARVLARLFNICQPIDTTAGIARLWERATMLVPEKEPRIYNSALMELGALVCLPRQPSCAACPVRTHCAAEKPETLPVKKSRPKTVALTERCVFITRGGRILLEQQTGRRWHGLWKLPEVQSRGAGAGSERLLYQAEYPFTHHRVTMLVFSGRTPRKLAANQRWFSTPDDAPMTAPHRRALLALFPVG